VKRRVSTALPRREVQWFLGEGGGSHTRAWVTTYDRSIRHGCRFWPRNTYWRDRWNQTSVQSAAN